MQRRDKRRDVEWVMLTTTPASPLLSGAAPTLKTPRGAEATWHYYSPATSRRRLIIALLISVGFHGALLLGFNEKRKLKPKPAEAPTIALTMSMPEVKELEELEPIPADDLNERPDLATPVPMQADVPQVPTPSDFVQKIDYSSLIERPDMSAAKVMAIPENISRGQSLAQRIGTIFNLADLDRIPEPLVQPSPVFPHSLRREVDTATVRVEFIVDTTGTVLNPVAVSSTHPGFNDAACVGVSKWKFRAGMRGGRKVNTRMQVPIVFRLLDNE